VNTSPTTTTVVVYELLHPNTNHTRTGIAMRLFYSFCVGYPDIVSSISNQAGFCVISWYIISTFRYITTGKTLLQSSYVSWPGCLLSCIRDMQLYPVFSQMNPVHILTNYAL